MDELKPCPFCGAADGRLVQAFTRATDDFAFWSVECLDCGVEVADDESQAAADKAWNTRAAPSRETREAAIRHVVGTCNRIPGATLWNAAEFMFDHLSTPIHPDNERLQEADPRP